MKKEYGIGGHSHALSRATGSHEDHDGKGLRYNKRDCADVKLNWNQVAKRIDELIRKGRYFTPEALEKYEAEKAAKSQEEAGIIAEETNEQVQETVSPPPAFLDYNDIKHDHRDDIVLYQVGDFFEMYGEDAKTAAEKLDLHLTTRPIPGAGRVDMCGVPAHALEQYVERLRESYGVTIAATITHENLLGNGKWQTRTVGVILRSEVYTGDLVQGQTKTVDHRQVKADADEWTIVRGTHEAIISREKFEAVQKILDQTAQRAKAREVKSYTPNILKGKVFCSHCGGSLHRQRNIRKKTDDVYLYHCLSRSRISKDSCPGATIREDVLLDVLADMLQEALNTALGKYTLSLAEQPQQAAERAELRDKITSRKQEIQRLRGSFLLQDWRNRLWFSPSRRCRKAPRVFRRASGTGCA